MCDAQAVRGHRGTVGARTTLEVEFGELGLVGLFVHAHVLLVPHGPRETVRERQSLLLRLVHDFHHTHERVVHCVQKHVERVRDWVGLVHRAGLAEHHREPNRGHVVHVLTFVRQAQHELVVRVNFHVDCHLGLGVRSLEAGGGLTPDFQIGDRGIHGRKRVERAEFDG